MCSSRREAGAGSERRVSHTHREHLEKESLTKKHTGSFCRSVVAAMPPGARAWLRCSERIYPFFYFSASLPGG